MRWFHAVRTRALLFSRRRAEERMTDEMAFHLEMEAARLVRDGGLDPDEARRRALVAFGGVEKHKETLRDGRGLAWLGGLTLDLKLGGRMLVKYPGLTIVGGLAMAFGIWFGAVTFQMYDIVTSTKREIGVRVALGASARRVITSIFKRPLIQVALGVTAGALLIAAGAIGLQQTQEFAGLKGRGLTFGEIATLAGYAIVMLGVCMLACVVPIIRALRVQPMEALRVE